MERRMFVVFGWIILFLSALPSSGNAALLYFEPSDVSVHRGDTVTLDLRLDTDEGECINTIDAVINYEPGIRAVDVARGESILNLWVEDPLINEVDRTISFAGGIIGGYCGRAAGDPSLTNVIAQIVFQSPGFIVGGSNPTAKVSISDISSILLNDGLGTVAPLRTQDAIITLLTTPGSERDDAWRDVVSDDATPPADFVINLSKDETAFSGQYFISFNTQDKQTGIDHYEVMEESLEDLYAFNWGRADAPWIITESPYVLKDQTLNSTIRVKAIDKAGNETIAVFVPDEALRSLSMNKLIMVSIVGAVALVVVAIIAYALIERKRRILSNYEEVE